MMRKPHIFFKGGLWLAVFDAREGFENRSARANSAHRFVMRKNGR